MKQEYEKNYHNKYKNIYRIDQDCDSKITQSYDKLMESFKKPKFNF